MSCAPPAALGARRLQNGDAALHHGRSPENFGRCGVAKALDRKPPLELFAAAGEVEALAAPLMVAAYAALLLPHRRISTGRRPIARWSTSGGALSSTAAGRLRGTE
jgi:hypothetical protein